MIGLLKGLGGGFERPVLVFTARTAFAACLALFLGWLFGLEHPQWAAMTVWAASQPTRGQLLEKGFYRFAGTIVGVLSGVSLTLLSGGNTLYLVVGLSLWIAACTALGHLVRGFLVYGVILSGYSAAMVALLDAGHPELAIHLGIDRFFTITLGVAVATIFGLLFTPHGAPGALAQAIRQMTARLLRLMAGEETQDTETLRLQTRQVLMDIAGLEEKLEPHGAGSRKAHRFVRSARALFISEVDALLWLRLGGRATLSAECRGALAQAGGTLAQEKPASDVLAALDCAAMTAGSQDGRERIERLRGALADHLGAPERADSPMPKSKPLVVLHSDWRGARSAAMRALLAMLTVGLFWVVTGFHSGPFLLLGLSIMISLFSTFENPVWFMRNVFFGQLAGVAGALACRWLVWPYVDTSSLSLVLAMMPFILLGALVMAHGRTRLFGFDYNMVLLLLLQPALPLKGDVPQWLGMGAAVAAAPVLAFIAYRLLPVDAKRRHLMLTRAMLAELKEMAVTAKPLKPRVRRARLHHRLLRMVQLGEKAGLGGAAAADRGFMIYGLGEIVMQIRRRAAAEGRLDRSLHLVLGRIADIDRRPDRLAQALNAAASRLDRAGQAEASDFKAAALAVRRQGASLVEKGMRSG